MSLKEAISQPPQTGYRFQIPRFDLDQLHQRMVLDEGNIVLAQSGVFSFIDELEEILISQGAQEVVKHPGGRLMKDGTVRTGIMWDPKDPIMGKGLYERGFKAFTILARPMTHDLVVQGQEAVFISQDEWKLNRDKVEQAIANAYNKPAYVRGPPSPLMPHFPRSYFDVELFKKINIKSEYDEVVGK